MPEPIRSASLFRPEPPRREMPREDFGRREEFHHEAPRDFDRFDRFERGHGFEHRDEYRRGPSYPMYPSYPVNTYPVYVPPAPVYYPPSAPYYPPAPVYCPPAPTYYPPAPCYPPAPYYPSPYTMGPGQALGSIVGAIVDVIGDDNNGRRY